MLWWNNTYLYLWIVFISIKIEMTVQQKHQNAVCSDLMTRRSYNRQTHNWVKWSLGNLIIINNEILFKNTCRPSSRVLLTEDMLILLRISVHTLNIFLEFKAQRSLKGCSCINMQYIYYISGIKWSENSNTSTILSLIAIFSRGTKFATMTGHDRILLLIFNDVLLLGVLMFKINPNCDCD